MSATELVGYAAALLTTLSFVPQAVLTFRTRRTEGVSLGMYSAYTLGIFLWLLYGIGLGMWPIILSNTVTFLLAAAILLMKLRFRG